MRCSTVPHEGRIKAISADIDTAGCQNIISTVFTAYFFRVKNEVGEVGCTTTQICYEYFLFFCDGLFIGKGSTNRLKLKTDICKSGILRCFIEAFLSQGIFCGIVVIKKYWSANNCFLTIISNDFICFQFQVF
ncbi:hypothetical protein D3C71_1613570 [compost metagenome]